tara:strand:- start:24224 stop:25486 length:1263 start_codon:yes stop_codon:yes gene_type:complete
MKKIKEYLKRYENFLSNIYDKGYFKSFSIKKPKESLLLLINFFPYFYLKPQIRKEKNKYQNRLYFKLKKENNIKFGLWSNIKYEFAILSQLFSLLFIGYNVILLLLFLSFFSKFEDFSISDFLKGWSPLGHHIEEQYNRVEFNDNIYNLSKKINKPLYQFKNVNEVSFEKFKNEYINNTWSFSFNGYDNYPENGSESEIKEFVKNKILEEYQKENYTYIYSNENNNLLFQVLDENNYLILNEKLLNNKDIFYSFHEDLNNYYKFEDSDNILFSPTDSENFVVRKKENYINIINVNYLSTNNTFSNFLYKGDITNDIILKSISIKNDKVRIFNYQNNIDNTDFIIAQQDFIKILNRFVIFYLLIFIWCLVTIPKFQKYIKNETKRREFIVFSSQYNQQLLLEDKRDVNIKKQTKKISVMSI